MREPCHIWLFGSFLYWVCSLSLKGFCQAYMLNLALASLVMGVAQTVVVPEVIVGKHITLVEAGVIGSSMINIRKRTVFLPLFILFIIWTAWTWDDCFYSEEYATEVITEYLKRLSLNPQYLSAASFNEADCSHGFMFEGEDRKILYIFTGWGKINLWDYANGDGP